MAAIETNELTKRYGTVTAVEGLDLRVREGEVFGFLGPNGAGKSTTIDLLLDLVRPTSGSASVLGQDPGEDPVAIRRRVGVLPEGLSLYDRLSGRKHVAFAIDVVGSGEDPDDLLDRVGLERSARDRPAGDYSTGMSQRLALAMALVGSPDLLILDEPSSGLDPNGMAEIREIVREEARSGTTVFFSSHHLDQVEAVCDRVGIMNDGRLVAVDTIEGLRASAGDGTEVTVTVDRVPEIDLTGIEGVAGASVEDQTIRARCTDSGAKARVITRVEEAGATVRDLSVSETPLEELFADFTVDAGSSVAGVESGDADGSTDGTATAGEVDA